MGMKLEDLNEKAPTGKKAKRFIRKARDDFKARYGDAWKSVLYATAWKLFNESALTELDAPQDMRAWLQGTKCCDASGKPLVMYHGVPHDYAGFDRFSDHPMGHFFTSDPDYAQAYAEKPIHADPDEDQGAIYPVYLSLKNPLVIDENDEEGVDTYSHHKLTAADIRARGHDGMMIRYSDGEVEAMVISAEQIVSTVQAHPLMETYSDEQPGLRAVIDGYRAWQPGNAPQCWMDFMPGDVPDELEIDSLQVEPQARHQGQGRRAMTEICRLADQHGITLSLMPVPNDEEGPTMDGDDLRDFYASFGFAWDETGGGTTMMMRYPASDVLSEGQINEGLIAIPADMLDHITFLMTYHFLWWAKWKLRQTKDDQYTDLKEVRAAYRKLEKEFGEEIPKTKYEVKNNVSITKIPVSVLGLPKSYDHLQPTVTSILFAIVWGTGHQSLGGWRPDKNALIVYPQTLSYMARWPEGRSHADDLQIALTTLKGTVEHELRHMMQFIFLGDYPEQRKQKAGYADHKADYNTSPIEFDPTIGSAANEFVSLWGIATDGRKLKVQLDFRKSLAKFVAAAPHDMADVFAPPPFFRDLKKGSPVRYRVAVKKFLKEVVRLLS